MKKIILLLLTAVLCAGGAKAQFADPIINIIAEPGTLPQNSNGLLEVTASNLGNSDIVANSLDITVTVGANATITGIAAGSDARWTQHSLSTGDANTIVLRNTAGGIEALDGTTIFLSITATHVGENNIINSTIAYVPGGNSLLAGNAQSSTQGNGANG